MGLIEDIFKRVPSVQNVGFTADAYKPGLERMRAFDAALGYPSRKVSAIHIAGTNGKGSVANMLASALTSAGYRTGLFTSPHIRDFRERMRIGPDMVPREYAEAFLAEWMPCIDEHSLSFFEITTGMALDWFAKSGADVAVIETGLGGRLDSTNIITPVLSIITSIGLDHCALLGNTREAIAREKAGIIKPGVPAIIGKWDAETAPVFDAAGEVLYANRLEPTLWESRDEILAAMDLQAPVQRENLRTVLAAIELLRGRFPGLANLDAVREGIEHTAARMHFHGRWERLRENPLVIADIGHNAHALESNFKAMEAMGKPLIIVFGIMADKDLSAIIPLMPRSARYIFVAPDTPRAMKADDLLRRVAAALPGVPLEAASSVCEGVKKALQIAAPDSVVYIGGSTFVVADALKEF